MYIDNNTNTILGSWDSLRLHLVQKYNIAATPDSIELPQILLDCNIAEYTPPVYQQTEQDIIAGLTNAVQNHLDDTARSKNYDGILSVCSYFGSTNPQFKADADKAIAWRDACWGYCYQVLSDVKAELRTVPTQEELILELPAIQW